MRLREVQDLVPVADLARGVVLPDREVYEFPAARIERQRGREQPEAPPLLPEAYAHGR